MQNLNLTHVCKAVSVRKRYKPIINTYIVKEAPRILYIGTRC